jgi:SAM-dependent methyltransferase
MAETYLHGHHDSVLRSHRWRTAENSAGYLLAHLREDARVLDVGCGPGTITVDLAARVRGGQVTGIDAAPDVLAEARQEADRRGQANVRFETGDVYRLAYADGTFDVVHAHQLLQHLSDPVRALGGEPDAGRHLLSWARAAGFAEVEASASAWCYTGPADRPWWGRLWAERLTESPFGDRAVGQGLARRADLERLARAWLRWADSEDGWFCIPHGEIVCRV